MVCVVRDCLVNGGNKSLCRFMRIERKNTVVRLYLVIDLSVRGMSASHLCVCV